MSAPDRVRVLITSGRGPVECQRAVMRLASILEAEARADGLRVGRGPVEAGDVGAAARSLVLELAGDGAATWAAGVAGPVRWIATSPDRPAHRRRNWFVEVVVLDSPAAPVVFEEHDVAFTAIRAGGPGGQRRNKVATGVRARHRPTGRVAVATEERSLAANRTKAIDRLAQQFQAEHDEAVAGAATATWANHNDVTRGDAVRTVRAPL